MAVSKHAAMAAAKAAAKATFSNTVCPNGGYRSHCPARIKCLYKHYDDDSYKQDANNKGSSTTSKLQYSSRLRSNGNSVKNAQAKSNSSPLNTKGLSTTTEEKTPRRAKLNDSDDLVSDVIEMDIISDDMSLMLIPDSPRIKI